MSLLTKLRKRNVNVYQIKYVEYTKLEQGYDCKIIYRERHVVLPKFKRPAGMTEEEMYKVLSYMYTVIKSKRLDQLEGHVISENMVTAEEVLKNMAEVLDDFHFEVVEDENVESKTLYVLDGDKKKSKARIKSDLEESRWGRKFSVEEVNKIYGDLGLEMPKAKVVDGSTFTTETI